MQEMNSMPERWYSTKEMCIYLGVTRDTLLTWINEKVCPHIKSVAAGNINPARSMRGSRAVKLRNN